jgi:hypothetical protein
MPKEESESKKQSNSEQWKQIDEYYFVCLRSTVSADQPTSSHGKHPTRPIQAPVRVKVKQAEASNRYAHPASATQRYLKTHHRVEYSIK